MSAGMQRLTMAPAALFSWLTTHAVRASSGSTADAYDTGRALETFPSLSVMVARWDGQDAIKIFARHMDATCWA